MVTNSMKSNSILNNNHKLKLVRDFLSNSSLKYNSFDIFLSIENDAIYSYKLRGNEALYDWKEIRKITDQSGFYPIILGENDQLDFKNTPTLCNKDSATKKNILKRGLSLVPDELFKQWFNYDPESFSYVTGDWEENPFIKDNINIPFDVITKQPLDVQMLLVPTKKSYEVPSILK